MKRKILVLVASILALACVCTGCSKFNYGPIDTDSANNTATVTSNGGTTVIAGSYLYFINGISSYSLDNTFGEVVKGAIYRVKMDADKNVVENSLQRVVPKKVFNSYKSGGFYVFGEWIYYATPSNVKDSSGSDKTTVLEFYKTKTDGTSTEMIKRIGGNSTPYAFSDKNLVYYLNNTLYTVDLTSDKYETTVIAEEVTSAFFPQQMEYDPNATGINPEFVVYYQKNSKEKNANWNETYVATFDGAINELVIGKESYFDESELGEITKPEDSLDYTRLFSVSILKVQDNVLYYTKTFSENGTATEYGVCSYDFGAYFAATERKFDKDSEVRYSLSNYSSVYAIDGGLLASDGAKIWLIKPVGDAGSIPEVVFTAANNIRYYADGYVYYTTGSTLDVYRWKMDLAGEPEQRQSVSISAPMESWLPIEFIDGYMYYQNSEYSYLYRLNVLEGTEEMLGEMSQADAEMKAQAEADEEE